MNRKVLGVLVSIVMAALGTFVILSYVRDADKRAVAGQETVQVLVVSDTIEKGASPDELAGRVESVLIPAKTQALGSVSNLDDLGDSVTSVDLVPGEQLLSSRFIAAEALESLEAIPVPAGYLQVTVSLSPERALGGALRPGDLVAFVASFDPFDVGAVEPGELVDSNDAALDGRLSQTKTPNTTHIVLHKILVTNVQIEKLPTQAEQEDAGNQSLELAPTGNLLVTLAMEAPDIEVAVFTAEHGFVWLAWEPDDAPEAGTRIQHRGIIYR
ncbi:MAG: hypothetical protein HKN07_00415 [Acidimicrobiia bacterium]|nr:hypothetical protein [Acidimicrobiia bacterium]